MKKYEDNRKYSVRKTLRITPAQWQMIQERMARVRLKDFNRYARQMLIDGYFFVIDDKEEIKGIEYVYEKFDSTRDESEIINDLFSELDEQLEENLIEKPKK